MTIGIRMKNIEISLGTEHEINELSNHLFDFNKKIVPAFVGRESPIDFIRYVIKEDNKIIAGILGKIAINNILYVDDLFVNESFRNKGLATALLNKVEIEAKLRGCYLGILNTINKNAVSFYEHRGYSTFAILKDVPCHGVNDVHMKKNL